MPIASFQCPTCQQKFFQIFMKREEYDAATHSKCPECGDNSPLTLSVPAKRNPAHGIQH